LLSGYDYQNGLFVETGLAGLAPAPGDYDGDGLADVAAYNRVNGQWLVRFSSDLRVVGGEYGGPEFTATPNDIDGDAKTDPVIYRETDGYWMGAASSRGYVSYDIYLGATGYQPVMADYDGDGLADPAVYNEITGIWGIALSGAGYRIAAGEFGGAGNLPAPADYDGDGLADPAVYAPATAYWQVLLSGSLAALGHYTWWGGIAGNINGTPVPADYDGDGKADFALYHQDTGTWEFFLSTQDYQLSQRHFGGPAYLPVTE
jgi:hypothetical protein